MTEPSDGSDTWLYVALGCGGLGLLTLCVLPFGAAFTLLTDDVESVDDAAPMSPDVTLSDPPAPAPPPGPAPAPPGLPPTPPRSTPPGPSLPPPPSAAATSPRRIRMSIAEAQGVALSPGSPCEFDVERHDRTDGTFWCRAQIRCGPHLLYGGGNTGYFDCTLYERPQRHVVGVDTGTSSGDGDPAFQINTLRGEVEVRDDASGANGAFTVRGRVLDVQ